MPKELPFHIVDVFAESKYAGNQLAVVLNSDGLSTSRMQQIAKEFHFSETTFVVQRDSKFNVRIFTPANELPFAGHPTLGTAFVIQQNIIAKKTSKVSLNLKVGEIPVRFNYSSGKPGVLWMRQNEPTFWKSKIDANEVADVLGLDSDEIYPEFPIEEVSTGVPFMIVPLKKLKSIRKCAVDRKLLLSLVKKAEAKSILVFSPEPYKKGSDISVRVFTDYFGIPEDPATGSGNGCLAAYLSQHKYYGTDKVDVAVDQGYELGRPSKLYLKASKDGKISIHVGGRVFPVARGTLGF